MVKKLELSYDDHLELIKHCKFKGIKFLSTAFDHKSINLLKSFNLPFSRYLPRNYESSIFKAYWFDK